MNSLYITLEKIKYCCMDELLSSQELSKYNRYILNRIIDGFEVDRDFNVYELVKESVSYKCILPSQNELVMDTYYNIKEYLVLHDFVVEKKEMISYILTGKGIDLKSLGSLDKYEENELKKNKKSLFHSLFFKSKKSHGGNPLDRLLIEYYE